MSNTLDSAYAWFGKFVEATINLAYNVFDLVIGSFSITSDTTKDNIEEAESKVDSVLNDKLHSNISQSLEEFFNWFLDYDDYQLLLIKIFVAILVGNCCFIYFLWEYYGGKISEQFMKEKSSEESEELKKKIVNLNLPREYSQQF